MAEDVTKKVQAVAAATADVKKQQEELNKKIEQSTKYYNEALASMKNYGVVSVRDLGKIVDSTLRLNVDIQKLNELNKEGYEYLVKKHETELKTNEEQIAALSMNISKNRELLLAYEKKAELLIESGAIAKAQLNEEYRLLEQSLKRNEEYEANLVRLHEEKSKKIQALEKATSDELFQNAVNMQLSIEEQSKTTVDNIKEHAAEVVRHTSGLWKGVIDVGAQKEHLEEAKEQLNTYLASLKDVGVKTVAEYDKEIKARQDSYQDHTDLIARRDAFESQHNKFLASETARVNGELAIIEKNGQDLRLQQFKEYTEKYQSFTTKMFEGTQAIANVFKQQSEMYKVEVANITQEIADNETARQEAKDEFEANRLEHELNNQNIRQQIEEKEKALGSATTEAEKAEISERIQSLQSGITDEASIKSEYDKEKDRLENEKRKKEKQQKNAKKMQDRIEMGQQIVQSIGNIAAGAAKALSYGPILGPILAAVVSAAGAVQVGIMTAQLAKMEDGGLLHGKRHSQGGMPILGSNVEVEGGEYVVNRQSTGKNLSLLHYINSERRELSPADMDDFFASAGRRVQPSFAAMLEEGGQLPAMLNTAQPDSYMLMDAIQSIKFEPKVSVTDINSVQADVVKVDSWVGM